MPGFCTALKNLVLQFISVVIPRKYNEY